MRGPYFAKLVIRKAALDAVPKGGGFEDAINFLTDVNKLKNGMIEAQKWAEQVLNMIKQSHENPYGDDDEAIAKAIIDKIEEKKANK